VRDYTLLELALPCHDVKTLEYSCERDVCRGKYVDKRTASKFAEDVIFHIKRVETYVTETMQHKRQDLVKLPRGVFNLDTDAHQSVWKYISAVVHHVGPGTETGHYYTFERTKSRRLHKVPG